MDGDRALTPTGQRPFPIGSANGSIWRVTLVYDGLARLSGRGATGTAEGGAGPLRLLSAGPMQYWTLIGVALLASTLLGLLALGVLFARGREPVRLALRGSPGRFAVGIVVWFLTGLVAFSAMERLQVRYLEAFAPAVCAVFGISLSALWRARLDRPHESYRRSDEPGRHRALGLRVLLACVGLGLLAVSLSKDVYVIGSARSDSLLTDFSTPALSRYLRSHNHGARYEVAGSGVNEIAGIVARDGLPALVLDSVDGPLVHTGYLRTQVAKGRVRFYFAPHDCHSRPHCPTNDRWAYAHSTPVPGYPGLRRFHLALQQTSATSVAG